MKKQIKAYNKGFDLVREAEEGFLEVGCMLRIKDGWNKQNKEGGEHS